jgi:hypothetical protein
MNAKEQRELNPNWFNVPFVTIERRPSGYFCCQCGGDINFYSEGETFDYFEDIETGELSYECEDCLRQ